MNVFNCCVPILLVICLFPLVLTQTGEQSTTVSPNGTNIPMVLQEKGPTDDLTTSTMPPAPLGPLDRLGQLAKSLSPFPLTRSAPATPNAVVASQNTTNINTSPGVADANVTNITGVGSTLNTTMTPLEVPPTATTTESDFSLDDGNQQQNNQTMNTTTTSTTPASTPSQPSSAMMAGFGWSLFVGILTLFVFNTIL